MLGARVHTLCAALLAAMVAAAQPAAVNSDVIKTVQLTVNDNWEAPAVLTLGSDDYLTLAFDELSPEYRRYTYRLTHCDAMWQPSDLFEIDYLDGFNNRPVEEYEPSVNTTMPYTHYRLTLPNDDVRWKLSGNYLLSLYDDEAGDDAPPVLVRPFAVVEPLASLSLAVSGSTDIDTNKSHQQVSIKVGTGSINSVSPQTEFTARVYQNRRPDNCATVKEPTYITASAIEYTHNPSLIFAAGNEFRRFEVIDMYNPSLNVDYVRFYDPYFHAFLYPDKVRRTYSYDSDQDGRFMVRSDAAYDVDTEADYLFVHYTLDAPPLAGGDFYVAGDFSDYRFRPRYRMEYNDAKGVYENIQLQKQGNYNYIYLWVPQGSGVGETGPGGGNFYETENEYMALLYHRPFGERYDKLVGFARVRFAQE